MNPEIIYEVYSQVPGEPIHTLWLCKSEDTANMLRDWEEASQYNWWTDAKHFINVDVPSYLKLYGIEFKVGENYLYE